MARCETRPVGPGLLTCTPAASLPSCSSLPAAVEPWPLSSSGGALATARTLRSGSGSWHARASSPLSRRSDSGSAAAGSRSLFLRAALRTRPWLQRLRRRAGRRATGVAAWSAVGAAGPPPAPADGQPNGWDQGSLAVGACKQRWGLKGDLLQPVRRLLGDERARADTSTRAHVQI